MDKVFHFFKRFLKFKRPPKESIGKVLGRWLKMKKIKSFLTMYCSKHCDFSQKEGSDQILNVNFL